MKVVRITSREALHAIRVDRKTIWGNPYKATNNTNAERDRVCNLFEEYAIKRHQEDPTWLAPLKGHNLACWCAPKRCHADTLLRLANELGLDKYLLTK